MKLPSAVGLFVIRASDLLLLVSMMFSIKGGLEREYRPQQKEPKRPSSDLEPKKKKGKILLNRPALCNE